MRPRCSILTGGFDFSGCGDFTSCPPVERAEMSNSEPSAIVLHGIPCMDGLYKFRFEWRKRFAQGSPPFPNGIIRHHAFHAEMGGAFPSRIRHRSAKFVKHHPCGLVTTD